MRVIVINHQRVKVEYWSIHKAGCKDIKRTVQETAGVSGGKFASVADALAETIDDEMTEMGFTEDDVKVYNCAS